MVAETYVGAEFCRNSDIKKKSKRPNSRATRKKECKKKKPPAQKKKVLRKALMLSLFSSVVLTTLALIYEGTMAGQMECNFLYKRTVPGRNA